MIIISRSFPDFDRPDYNIDAPCPLEGWPSGALLASATQFYYPEHTAPLGISASFGGESVFDVGNTVYRTADSHYLLLNEGQRIARTIDSRVPVTAFAIGFSSHMISDTLRGMTTSDDELLSDPHKKNGQSLHFHESLYPTGDRVSSHLAKLREMVANSEKEGEVGIEFEEEFVRLLTDMLGTHREVVHQILRLPPVKRSTKIELFRRISEARDYLHAHYDEPITLDELAHVACLSRYHFLRTFKSVYRLTPHQYLIRLRCTKAYEMLTADETLTVREVTRRAGLKSVGSFTRQLTREFGVSPKRLTNGKPGDDPSPD